MRYPINYHILAEDFRDRTQQFSQEDARWLLDALLAMCNAYDDLLLDQLAESEPYPYDLPS